MIHVDDGLADRLAQLCANTVTEELVDCDDPQLEQIYQQIAEDVHFALNGRRYPS
jgi:hypothetical protein